MDCFFFFYNYCSVYWTTLYSPPALFRCSRTLSAHCCLTSSTPPRTPSAYWQSTLFFIALFVKVSPGRACNDYNVTFLCWCEMTNISSIFFISKLFHVIDRRHQIHLKTLWCDSWDIQVKVYLAVPWHYPAQPFRLVLVLTFVLGNFLVACICTWHHFLGDQLYFNYTIGH